jgi:hypothetical protein
MKSSEFRKLVDNSLYNEDKKRIITESESGNYEVFEVICEGELYAVCETEKEAKEIVYTLKDKHSGKQLIIEKKTYKSWEE